MCVLSLDLKGLPPKLWNNFFSNISRSNFYREQRIRVQRAEASHRVPENSSAREREHVQLREKKEDSMKEREWGEERRVRREE